MRLGDFSGIITSMFTDRMDVFHYIDEIQEDGTTQTKLSNNPAWRNAPCRISLSTDENPSDNQVDSVPIKTSPKIFFKTSVALKAGDYVVVRRFDDDGNVMCTYSGKAGMPSVFITHKEVLFHIEGTA